MSNPIQEQINALLSSGNGTEGCTANEIAVLKNLHHFENMDTQIETAGCFATEFDDGVEKYAGVPRHSIGGIVSSLVKKGFIESSEINDNKLIDITPKGIAAWRDLNDGK